MKAPLFEALTLKFESPNWARNPEFGLLDSILEARPELINLLSSDITQGEKRSKFGRKDIPSVNQIVRAAIYKELKQLNYRELEYHQIDSRICAQFLNLDQMRPYSFQVFQKYISRIQAENLDKLLVELNTIAINQGLEDLESLRQDSTVVESDIHYPTNNALVWDCIKESHRLLEKLKAESDNFNFRDYRKGAKRTYFKINNTRSKDKRVDLFRKQLSAFTKSINQVANAVKKKSDYNHLATIGILSRLEELLPLMHQVYDMTERKEVKKEKVPKYDKIFSIYERHTDIIVKGSREVFFGHKVNMASGKSNLILTCDVLKGNPTDTSLYKGTLEKVESAYGKMPKNFVTDGGYASKANMEYAKSQNIVNVVFNKIVGSLKNEVSSLSMETRLNKWRAGAEAIISNIKRKFGLSRCDWKGWDHFRAKVLWSAIAYNIRVMTGALLLQLA